MEEQRIRQIARVVREAFEEHRDAPIDFAVYLQQHGVSRVDVMEALEDVERVDVEGEEGTATLLRLAVDRLGALPRHG